ncbi:MAG: hypothetical protein KGI41_03190 [Patescibacteria group bacterium]|nr:hypothetical protein [Patescibacteria group bacterium]
MKEAKTVVLYHSHCPDGFGGAYAAWKKFGDKAEYLPVQHGKPPPEATKDADVYLIDLCYRGDVMDELVKDAASLVVLDHHQGVEDVVTRMPQYVYDLNRSGASIAWAYFHPGTPMPELLSFVEDDDLFRFKLLETKPVLALLSVLPFTFEKWDELAGELEDPNLRQVFMEKAWAYREYFDLLVGYAVERARLVRFEGHEVYLGEAHPLKPMESAVGNALARKKGPFALIVHARRSAVRVSLRGDGTIDVAAIARKYGGNGHPSSAAFSFPWGTVPPWEKIEE